MDEERLYQDRKGKVVDFPRTLYSGHGQQQQQLECFSDEVDSRDGAEEEKKDASEDPPPPPAASGSGRGDGSSVETGKRKRGRPPGSKNKPKPPVVVTREAAAAAAAMRPYILEIPGGVDVAGALAGFARRRGLGICVLAGTGAVANVSLRHPSSPAGDGGAATTVVFRGRHDILSISATFLPPSVPAAVPRGALGGGLSISLAGPHGQIVGGAVAGPLVVATTVVVVAAVFTDPTFHRLPADDVDASASVSGSGEADEHRGRQLEPQEQRRVSQSQPHIIASAIRPVSSLYAGRAPAATTPSRPPYQ